MACNAMQRQEGTGISHAVPFEHGTAALSSCTLRGEQQAEAIIT
jgi:hypothetical protein